MGYGKDSIPVIPTNLEIGNIKNTVNQLIFSVFCFYAFSLISNDTGIPFKLGRKPFLL
jgi:hypothetical protein